MEECGRKVLVFSDKCINSPINAVNIYSYFFLLVNSVVGTASHSNKLFGKFQTLKITSKLELKSRYVIVKFPSTMKLRNAGFANPLVATLPRLGVCIAVSNPSSTDHPLVIISCHANSNKKHLIYYCLLTILTCQHKSIISAKRRP